MVQIISVPHEVLLQGILRLLCDSLARVFVLSWVDETEDESPIQTRQDRNHSAVKLIVQN